MRVTSSFVSHSFTFIPHSFRNLHSAHWVLHSLDERERRPLLFFLPRKPIGLLFLIFSLLLSLQRSFWLKATHREKGRKAQIKGPLDLEGISNNNNSEKYIREQENFFVGQFLRLLWLRLCYVSVILYEEH